MTGLHSLPRVELATTPTPLRPAPRLSAAAGVEVWLKRDDLTGLGLGGNKVRALEFLIGDALDQGCDCLVTGAGAQSNWAMLAALAARRSGLDAHLLFYGDAAPSATGNRMLAELAGAEISFTGDPERTSVDAAIDKTAAVLRAAGRRPYVLPRGGATARGALGYVAASLELAWQLAAVRLAPTQLWLATGSCGTQAGLVAGARWLALPYDVVGVSVSRPADECVARVEELARGAAELVGVVAAADETSDVLVRGGHLGPGYGQRSVEGDAAAALVARTEGVFLDPVFAAKAMAALLGDPPAGPVVFLVTGGAPTLFSVPRAAAM
ncbi:MAG: D-cysteine desulfhydrase [Actinomycetota bacterium]|nr:D-cysteine desulfhydrase [Actinomycetota bacterium]